MCNKNLNDVSEISQTQMQHNLTHTMNVREFSSQKLSVRGWAAKDKGSRVVGGMGIHRY